MRRSQQVSWPRVAFPGVSRWHEGRQERWREAWSRDRRHPVWTAPALYNLHDMNDAPEPLTAKSRLDRLLADDPDAARLSLAEIARVLGVSRERVRQLRPDWYSRQEQALIERVRRYVAEHPDAVRSGFSGGPTWSEVAADLELPVRALWRIWRKASLPNRSLSTAEELFTRRAAREALRSKRVLREERCVVCGRRFNWTAQMEHALRRKGNPVTCSILCTRQLKRERGLP